jgi:hypothetical protein
VATFWVVAIAVGAVLAGLLAGIFLARQRISFAPAADPFGSLLVAVRPLLLPLFAAIVVGLAQLPFWVPILGTAVLAFVAVRFIWMPETRQAKEAENWDLRLLRRIGKHAGWLVVATLVLAAIAKAGSSGRPFHSIGGFAAYLLVFALVLWTIAFLLRFLSYASSWLKVLVALFVVLSGLRLGAAIGLVPGGDWLSAHAPWLDWALPAAAAFFIGLEAALDVVAEWRDSRLAPGRDPPSALETILGIRSTALRPRSVRLLQGLGLIASVLAAIALGTSAVVALAETAQPGEKLSTESAVLAEEEPGPGAPGRFSDDLALAKAYAPVLAFTHDERWSPIAVDSYAREAALSGPLREPPTDPGSVTEKLDRSCPRLASAPCYRLSIRCEDGKQPCAMASPHPDRDSERLYREGDVYVRVEKRSVEEAEERKREAEGLRKSDRWPPRVFVEEGPYRKPLSVLLQYWYFYRYDEWETHAFAGELVQRHEGDWEAVTIGLSEREPLFVAYSAHCAGTWKPWSAVELSDKFPEPTHPLVAVAEGSHANYPNASQKRSPDWAGCQGAPAGTTTLLSYASNIRDKTEYGWQWYPAEDGWLEADAETPPMSFPGYWGASESTTLYGLFKETSLGEGHGPQTPTEQPLWRSPVTKIFCGNYTGPERDYRCKEE